eukprot:354480-Chlamydomonas_euryale.AAC.1
MAAMQLPPRRPSPPNTHLDDDRNAAAHDGALRTRAVANAVRAEAKHVTADTQELEPRVIAVHPAVQPGRYRVTVVVGCVLGGGELHESCNSQVCCAVQRGALARRNSVADTWRGFVQVRLGASGCV